jgi:uncharacterized RDD family membrane protein YckC
METVDTPTYQSTPQFAGFWLRLAAYIIDYFLISFVLGIVATVTMLIMGVTLSIFSDMDNPASQMMVVSLSIIIGVTALIASWLYYALLESSNHQGTLGKMVLNLKVTDLDGNKISFYRASGRFFAKLLSTFIVYIGYLMIGFTEKKQGLHDILTSCLVVRK